MCLGIPGQIEKIDQDSALSRRGVVNFSGTRREVQLAFVPDAKVGDYVIVHVGIAISVVNEAEAKRTLEYLSKIGEDSP